MTLMLRFDLHVHTSYSKDGQDTVEEILKAAKAKGLDGVAITDHNTTAGARRALEVRDQVAPGLLVIPGEEVSTRSGHLIVLGILEDIPRDMSVEDTIKAGHELGGTVVVPHPYNRLRHGISIPEGTDAVEVYNSRFIFGFHNHIASSRSKARNLPGVAGSDAHAAEFVGTAVTLVNTDQRTVQAVLKAIREGKTEAIAKRTPLHVYATQIVKGWAKKARAYFIE
jgi:predicted metal-dependent phosphoesterase TrpH